MTKTNTFESLAAKTSFQFNELERRLDRLIFVYMKEDSDVFDRVMVSVRNVSKGALFNYLITKRDRSKGMAEHAAHFVKGFNILRENRNTIQHAIPERVDHVSYTGKIVKLNSVGIMTNYEITISDMIGFWSSMNDFLRYGYDIEQFSRTRKRRAFAIQNGFSTFEAYLASFRKPAPPRKLDPLAPQEGRQGE